MSKRKLALWLSIALSLLILGAICVPNFTTRHADVPKATSFNIVADRPSNALMLSKDSMGLAAPPAASTEVRIPDRKLIHNAELRLTVANVRAVADQIQRITESGRGEIERLEINGNGEFMSATLLVRVPASGLVTALADYKKLAIRTDQEQITASDVTREFYDNEAHLRSLQAEEQQYLAIMKRAGKIPDVLQVSEKLSDVRDRIERLQTQIQVMNHDIDMSAVQISLNQQPDTRIAGTEWRPWYNAKTATHDLLVGLGVWVDWVVQFLIELPLILLWGVTIGGLLWIAWKAGRGAWRRLVKGKNAGLSSGPAGPLAGVQPAP